MTINVTLKASGIDSGPFSIYQDSDNFATALATGVTTNLLTIGFEVDANINTKFVKVFSESSCNAVAMVSAKFADTTPSVVSSTVATIPNGNIAKYVTTATDNKDGIIVSDGGNTFVSVDTGDTFVNNAEMTSVDARCVTYDSVSSKFFVIGSINNEWWEVTISGATVTVTPQTASLPGSQRGSAFFHNGVLYIKDLLGVYRSEDLITFVKVANFDFTPTSSQYTQAKSFAGYAKTVFCADNRNGLYRSTDNGLNWSKLTIRPNPIEVQIDQDGRVFLLSSDAGFGTQLLYSDDLGSTWSVFDGSTNLQQPFEMNKYGRLWFLTKNPGNGSRSLAYKIDVVSSSTETLLPNTNLATQPASSYTDFSKYSIFSCKDRTFLMGQSGSNTLIIKNIIAYT